MLSKTERPIKLDSPRRASSISLSLILLLGMGVVGCGDHAADEVPTNEAPALGEGVNDREATPKASPLLFKDPNTNGPRLDVYDANGHAAVAVSGPIGSEGILGALDDSQSLTGLYRAIHGTAAAIPNELTLLEGRFAAEFAAIRSNPRHVEPVADPTLGKSWNSFVASVCKRFRASDSTEYKPIVCIWDDYSASISSDTNNIQGGDRTYGWNANSGWSFLRWIEGNSVPGGIYIQPYWWTWFTIFGGGPYGARIACISNAQHPGPCVSGERGLTWHSLRSIVE
jgi:hypothetical protein